MCATTLRSAELTASLERYRPALTGHCCRMLGPVVDAEDVVQESMLRAWKAIDRFQEQASLETSLCGSVASPALLRPTR